MSQDWLVLLADPESPTPLVGDDESVAATWIRIGGHRVMLAVNRFDVAAGTLSVAAGQRLVQAFDAAIADGVPVLAITNSGGARMQEGTRAFVQMIEAAKAARRVRSNGLPLLVYLANPTTGGVFASWGSLGSVTFAEPGATIGFTGPRVAAALGEPIHPAETQTAEGLFANGLVDGVIAPERLRGELISALDALAPAEVWNAVPRHYPDEVADGPHGWAAVTSSRRPARGDVLERLLKRATASVEVRGDRSGSVDLAVYCAITRVDDVPLVVIAHRQPGARPSAAGLRSARRAMVLAQELGLPVVTIVDTAGAVIGGEQETEGFAGEIAKSLDTLSSLTVPTVTVIAGQGCGGAAMAWLASREIIAAPDAWIAPIAPEAASLIVRRDTDHAAEMADLQRVSATELREQGIVARVVAFDHLVDAALASIARRD
ncbi:MAG: acetyl-CoA carboxyl transferase [Actinobacteria bacterium]|nr:acetyl-CoA carboxyl transferase [Actinomycetota bacterium]